MRALQGPVEAWLTAARAVVDFFNHLNMLYGTISEFCTPNEVRARVWPFIRGLL